jgi:hypothetical protein
MVDAAAPEKKRKLIYSMLVLAGVLGASVVLTALAASYFRGQDPVNQCITDPSNQPYQLSVPIEVHKDGSPIIVTDVGFDDGCIRPVHTLTDNVIHVAYSRPHDFTLGHFFYYWLGNEIAKYDVQVRVNENLHSGDFRDIVLKQGDTISVGLFTRE